VRTLIVIPVYECYERLSAILPALAAGAADICVVDDGSASVPRELRSYPRLKMIVHNENRGKGAALRTGFAYALEQGYEAVVTMDGDGQHDPADIDALTAKCGAYDLVLGARDLNSPRMPFSRRCSNRLSSYLISKALKADIPDSQCGFRCMTAALLRSVDLKSDGYEMETEMIMKAAALGFSMASVPVSTIYNGSRSFIKGWRDTARVVAVFLRHLPGK